MQSVSSRIWTRVAVSISYNDNHYTTGTSNEKDDTLSVQSLINRVEQTGLNAIFFSVRFLLNMALRYYWEEESFSYGQVQCIFLQDFHAHVSYLFQVAADIGFGCVEFKC